MEVVRGPSSVLWGADALAGVVAVETQDPEDILQGRDRGVEAEVGYMTVNQEIASSLTFAQQVNSQVSFLLGLAQSNAHEHELSNARGDGGQFGCGRNIEFGATGCDTLNPADISTTRGLSKLVWMPDDVHRFEFSMDIMRRNNDVDNRYNLGPQRSSFDNTLTGEILEDSRRELKLTRQHYALEHQWKLNQPLVNTVKTTLAYSPYEYESHSRERSELSNGDKTFETGNTKYQEDFVELDVQFTSLAKVEKTDHVLTWGFDGDLANTDYSSTSNYNNLTTGATSSSRLNSFAKAETRRADVYLQDQILLAGGALELTPGVRLATYSIDPSPGPDYEVVEGSEPKKVSKEKLLASFGALYHFDDDWSIWGAYSEGFKMPTARQLYTSRPGSFFNLVPAPDLQPEEVKSIEVGVRGEFDRAFFSLNAFGSDYENFIENFYFIPGTNDITFRNLSEVRLWGIEGSASYQINDTFTLNGSAAWKKGRQRTTSGGEAVPFTTAPFTATVGVAYDSLARDYGAEVLANLASKFTETSTSDGFKPPGYGTFDAYAYWDIMPSVRLNVGIINIFDKRYFEEGAAGMTTTPNPAVARTNPIELQTGAGRNFSASVAVKF